MARSLFDRLCTWIRLYGLRPDVETRTPLTLDPPEPQDPELPAYPKDAALFAKKTSRLYAIFRLMDGEKPLIYSEINLFFDQDDDDPEFDLEDVEEDLLALSGEDASLPDTPVFYNLDADNLGGGEHTWYVFPENGKPVIIWDIEHMVLFANLGQYLKEGAKRAFCQNWAYEKKKKGPFTYKQDAAAELRKRSLPKDTPEADLKAGLIAQGATEEEAVDLIAWLGNAVCLLLPLKA